MTSLVPRSYLASQENQQSKMKSGTKQGPGGSGRLAQKQMTESTPGSRQALRSLSNSISVQSSKTNTTKLTKSTVPLKSVVKPGSSKKTHKKIVASTMHVTTPSVIDEFPEIESLPKLDDDIFSPFVEPSYFKALTDSLKYTTVTPAPSTSLANIRSGILTTRLTLQQRPTENQWEEIMDCVESAEEPSTPLLDPLPPLPDFDW
ncbi:uncharacterized protein LOC135352138 [Halichondria panicea]|uniref:uncharacterized protein LOC135352138 n=1 Tax=Halichondria panicea TaxID=6063 RepID=UPI00312BC679